MVEKISVQIALEGGEAVQRQLEGIGQAGQKAFDDLAKSAEKVGGFKNLPTEEVTAQLKAAGVEGKELSQTLKAVGTAVKWETLVTGALSVETAFTALGHAAGPVAAAIAAAFIPAVKAMSAFAESITQLNAEAIKLGTTVEQFSRLQLALEKTGLSGKDVGSVFTKLGQAADAAALDKVTKALKELQDAGTRGFGPQGTQQLRDIEEAAKGVGPAADAARKALEELGLPIPTDVPKTLKELVASTGNAQQGLVAFLAQLQEMPAGVARTKFAAQELGISIEAASKLLAAAGGNLERFKGALAEQKPAGLITEADLQNAEKFQTALAKLSRTWENFKASVVTPIATTALSFLASELEGINQHIATTKREWEGLKNILSAVTPKGGIDISATQSLAPLIDQANQAAAAVNKTTQALGQAGQAAEQAKQSFQIVPNPFTGMPEAINTTTQALQQTGQAAQQTKQQFQIVPNPFTGMPEAINTTNQALQQTGQTAQQAGQQTAQAGQQGTSAWQTLPAAVDQAIAKVTTFASTMATITWDAISSVGVAAWNALTGAIQSAIDALLRYIGLKPSAPATGGNAPGAARGGLLGGRGTGTSDSNLAWVSRGEHIMPAHAVSQPGVLAFLEALRRSGGDLSRVLDGMGRFALGGMVPRAMPAFATGGLVGGMSNVTIQFPGLPDITGLRASSGVVDELRKAAALAQVRSGGRKPSRYS